MYVLPGHRGQGVARELLAFLEAEAVRRGIGVMRLETGNLQPQALRFYESAGYVRRGPFGDYDDDPHSVFMEKALLRNIAAEETRK
jgi:putative acetyltransferase